MIAFRQSFIHSILKLFFLDLVVDSCDALSDPFEEYPVDSFLPPSNAAHDDILHWMEEVREMMKRITKQTIGGEPLRTYIHGETAKLKKERLSLFCKSVLKS
jgi:hypothetical protein